MLNVHLGSAQKSSCSEQRMPPIVPFFLTTEQEAQEHSGSTALMVKYREKKTLQST